jgi:hypothetical protein
MKLGASAGALRARGAACRAVLRPEEAEEPHLGRLFAVGVLLFARIE